MRLLPESHRDFAEGCEGGLVLYKKLARPRIWNFARCDRCSRLPLACMGWSSGAQDPQVRKFHMSLDHRKIDGRVLDMVVCHSMLYQLIRFIQVGETHKEPQASKDWSSGALRYAWLRKSRTGVGWCCQHPQPSVLTSLPKLKEILPLPHHHCRDVASQILANILCCVVVW